MTGPEVLISGGDEHDAPRRLPVWLRRGVPLVVVAALLVVLGTRLAHDQRLHEQVVQAADEVEAAVRINETGLGAGGSVVVGIQVSGRGAAVRVDEPRLRPSEVARAAVSGAPAVVDAGSGSQLRLRLQPDCARAPLLTEVGFDLPITPASGKRHVLRLPFPEGPSLLRRACGYLPVDEALTILTNGTWVVRGHQLQVHASLRNDGRDPLTVTGVRSPGLALDVQLPLQLLPGAVSAPFSMVLRVTNCPAVPGDPQEEPAVLLQVANPAGQVTEVPLPIAGRDSSAFQSWLAEVCP